MKAVDAPAAHERIPGGVPRWLLVVGTFLVVWAAKLIVIGMFGTDLPYWDQWAKEGELFFAPWYERGEFWRNLFVPHNEHRIAPTLALNWALLQVGGHQWDARVQCAASAGLHALIAAGFAWTALRHFSRRQAIALCAVGAAVVGTPITWENILGGFQSQFYFLIGFSLLTLWSLLGATPRSWWSGLLFAALAVASMGSGFLVGVPLIAAGLWGLADRLRAAPRAPVGTRSSDAMVRPGSGPYRVAPIAIGVVVLAVGMYLRTPTPWHEPLHAKTAGAFLAYFGRCLSWPIMQTPWLAALWWAPIVVLGVQRLRRRAERAPQNQRTTVDDFILAAGLWVLVQIAAVSYSRAGGSLEPASRYGDVAAIGLLLNAFALARLVASNRHVWFAGWTAAVAICLVVSSTRALSTAFPQKLADSREYERAVRTFLLTDDAATFEQERALPFPIADWMTRILRNPTLRRLMPSSVRPPERIEGLGQENAIGPTLPSRATRTITAGEAWQSGVVPPGAGYWVFQTAGDMLHEAATLALAASDGQPEVALIRPTKPPGEHWRAAYVSAPRDEARLVARVESPAHWIAFSEPVAMSTLSYRVWRLCLDAEWLLVAGGLLFGSTLAILRRRCRTADVA